MLIDRFGLSHEYKPLTGPQAHSWYSVAWANGIKRTIISKGTDVRNEDRLGNKLFDNHFDFHCRDVDKGVTNKIIINGDGIADIYGRGTRIYIGDPTLKKLWLNVEMTWSVCAIATVPGGGATVVTRGGARSNHNHEFECAESGNGYYGESKWNDINQIKGEVVHSKGGGYAKDLIQKVKGVPKKKWTDYKLVVVNVLNQAKELIGVLIQYKRCRTSKSNKWELLGEFLHTGENWMVSGSDLDAWRNAYKDIPSKCKKFAKYPPPKTLTSASVPMPMLIHPGETCYFRNDNVHELIANASVVEIAPIIR